MSVGAWPSGKAPLFGSGIRRFESSRPSQGKKNMSNFLNKYKSVYDVFLDNWSYQSHFVLYLEALMRQQTYCPLILKK